MTDTLARRTDHHNPNFQLSRFEKTTRTEKEKDLFELFSQYPTILNLKKMTDIEKCKAYRTISSRCSRTQEPIKRQTLRRRSSLVTKIRTSPQPKNMPIIQKPRSNSTKRESNIVYNGSIDKNSLVQTNFLPSLSKSDAYPDEGKVKQKLVRYRSFKMTKKGIVNLGDSLRSNSSTNLLDVGISRNPSPLCSTNRTPNVERNSSVSLAEKKNYLKVNDLKIPMKSNQDENQLVNGFHPDKIEIGVVGSPGVGKTTLCRQLLTSEHIGANINESFYEEDIPFYVNVELNGRIFNVHLKDESITKLISAKDGAMKARLTSSYKRKTRTKLEPRRISTDGGTHGLLNNESDENCEGYEADEEESIEDGNIGSSRAINAIMIVYAIDDMESYEYAKNILKMLHENMGIWRLNGNDWSAMQIFLVGNKSDLVRSRVVDAERAKRLSMAFKCGFFEISTVMNHLVDDLLIAIIRRVSQSMSRKSISHRILLQQTINQNISNSKYSRLKIISDNPEDMKKRHKNSILQRGNNFLSIFKRYLPSKSSEDINRNSKK